MRLEKEGEGVKTARNCFLGHFERRMSGVVVGHGRLVCRVDE